MTLNRLRNRIRKKLFVYIFETDDHIAKKCNLKNFKNLHKLYKNDHQTDSAKYIYLLRSRERLNINANESLRVANGYRHDSLSSTSTLFLLLVFTILLLLLLASFSQHNTVQLQLMIFKLF